MATPSIRSQAEHAASFAADGFTVFHGAMSEAQLARGRAFLDGARPESHPEFVLNLFNREGLFRELVQWRPLLDFAESLLGGDCVLSSASARIARPGTPAQLLHRDSAVWGPSMLGAGPVLGINVAWAFDDFTPDNGATQAVIGSHRTDGAPDPKDPRAVPLLASAGSCIAFDIHLIHGGAENRSARARRAAFASYIRGWMKPQVDLKRSTSPAALADASPTLLRLFGFQRQSAVDTDDGRSLIVEAPGATAFYGQKPDGFTS